jgi:hypothetical protein
MSDGNEGNMRARSLEHEINRCEDFILRIRSFGESRFGGETKEFQYYLADTPHLVRALRLGIAKMEKLK